MATIKNKLSKEEVAEIKEHERNASNILYWTKDLKEKIDKGIIPAPTRLLKVGDHVIFGARESTVVTEVLFDGYGYKVHCDYMGQTYGKPTRYIDDHIVDWLRVYPLAAFPKGDRLSTKDDIQIRYYNNAIDSLLSKVYSFGVDFNPDYQRDLVWTKEQKLSLLDSIFDNVEIGKFTFIQYAYSKENANRKFHYEIIDGKQRLSTLCEFYEDRLVWRGKKYSELCFTDAYHFTSFPVVQGEVSELTQQQIYRLFVKMNTSGTPMDKEHLDRVKSLIK